MKKTLAVMLSALLVLLCSAGCDYKKEKAFPSDEEIMSALSGYLGDAVLQDPAIYPSLNDFLSSNLGLSDKEVSDAVLYMGASNRNTTFFAMLTVVEGADHESIKSRLDSVMQGQVKTAEMGYTSGSTEYSIIEKGDKIFAVMHEDPDSYSEMLDYLNSL